MRDNPCLLGDYGAGRIGLTVIFLLLSAKAGIERMR
jgi:hypothetical protein